MPPLCHLHKLLSHEVTTAESLSHGDQSCQLFISHLLKCTQQTGLEEHLDKQKTETYCVFCTVHIKNKELGEYVENTTNYISYTIKKTC